MKWIVLGATLAMVACSSKNSSFGNGNGDGGSNDGGGPFTSDACALCGTDASQHTGDGDVPCIPNPANYDIPGNGCDDDGDGQIDNAPACDANLPQGGTAMQLAQAMGLCQQASNGKWGVVSAKLTQGYGSSAVPDAHQTSILTSFGSALTPREGQSFSVLSSGYAQPTDACPAAQRPTYSKVATSFKYGCAMTGQGQAPSGFPKSATGCPSQNGEAVNDVADLQLVIKVPNNANGFSFDFDFGSGEWPDYVCSPFNDAFIAYLKSAAFNSGNPDNISFDSKNNPVSVNNGFFSQCGPSSAATGCATGATPGTATCTGGTGDLAGTGFLDLSDPSACATGETGGGMTGWLTTQAPAQPGETLTIDLIIWDTGDQYYDSSVILDNWQWKPDPTTVSTNPN
jgi:hypothetical protein